ncbi:MAG TPA: NADP-dependent phosphogluconate dehydrogenase [Gammaproteobacteria bacterium]|nr:NADP-dependent phosphogluconate dehydrogenase [Gammaproteobacteria bacterium]
MANQLRENQCVIGMVGLGVMGRNLLLNMADHGFTVAGYDQDKNKVESLQKESKKQPVYGATSVESFLKLLQKPRVIMLLVPAGAPVDLVINELIPHLQTGDLIIDAGNSHFTDTDIRAQHLQAQGIQFLGIGISGGEKGARLGPSMMPGGPKAAYERVRPILQAIAAKVNNDPCVTYLGPGSVGHYVKMVHNGIEYGIMQLIAETYDLLKRGLGLRNEQLSEIYQLWNETELNSYLIEITSRIFAKKDEQTTQSLIDEIVAVAKQNGTGMWTSQSAMTLQVPVPTIDVAVNMRDLSVLLEEREQANRLYQRPIPLSTMNHTLFITQLQQALYCAILMVYAQGMALLGVASHQYAYQLNLEAVARIWRGGCIIRARLLEDISTAFRANKHLKNLLLDPNLAQHILTQQDSLRQIVREACNLGLPIPGFMSALAYLDAYRSLWLPANLIQAQRDYFGAHTYERIDMKGTFHTEWEKDS